MAQSWTEICVFLVSVSMLWRGAVAQSSCTNVLLSMASCLNFVTGSSSSPSSSCCSSFARVVQSQPQCLCTALNGGGSALGVNINQTLALALPGACNVQTPPVGRCKDANGQTVPPLGSPETSPVGFPDETPDSPATGSSFSGGSKAVPSNAATNSDGNTLKTPLQLAAFLVFAASYASISSKL